MFDWFVTPHPPLNNVFDLWPRVFQVQGHLSWVKSVNLNMRMFVLLLQSDDIHQKMNSDNTSLLCRGGRGADQGYAGKFIQWSAHCSTSDYMSDYIMSNWITPMCELAVLQHTRLDLKLNLGNNRTGELQLQAWGRGDLTSRTAFLGNCFCFVFLVPEGHKGLTVWSDEAILCLSLWICNCTLLWNGRDKRIQS